MVSVSMQAFEMKPQQSSWLRILPVTGTGWIAGYCFLTVICGIVRGNVEDGPIVNLAPELRAPDELGLPGIPIEALGADSALAEERQEVLPVIIDPGMTTSVSGQFVVHGPDSDSRVWASRLAERMRSHYHDLLGARVPWRHKITIQLYASTGVSPQGPSIRESISALGLSSYRFQIDVRLDAGLTDEAMEESVMRMILAEQVLRNYRPDEVKEGELLPDWLWTGVVEAIRYQKEPSTSLFQRALTSGGRMLPVERLLQGDMSRMTSVTRGAYRVTSCGLILTMLDKPNGGQRFNRLLADVARYSGDPIRFIQNHFHDLGGEEHSLDKWWALQVVRMAKPGGFDFLSGSDSDEYLKHLLVLEWTENSPDGQGEVVTRTAPLHEYQRMMGRSDRVEILVRTEESLRALRVRAHPVYRAVIEDYIEIVEELKKRRPGGVEEKLDAAEEYRAAILRQLDGIDDYLNWWEVRHGSGAEEIVRRYRDAGKAVEEQMPRRGPDPISEYLDGMQGLMER